MKFGRFFSRWPETCYQERIQLNILGVCLCLGEGVGGRKMKPVGVEFVSVEHVPHCVKAERIFFLRGGEKTPESGEERRTNL